MMDLTNLGLDMLVVGGIISITKVVTSYDKKKKYKRWYPVIPCLLGVVVAYFLTDPFLWKAFGNNVIAYVGAPTYLYKFGKTTVLGA